MLNLFVSLIPEAYVLYRPVSWLQLGRSFQGFGEGCQLLGLSHVRCQTLEVDDMYDDFA
jgi:hypothetical protein